MEKSLHSFFQVGATFLSVSIILLCNDPVILSDREKPHPLFYLSHIDRHAPPGCIEANTHSSTCQNRKESNFLSGTSSDVPTHHLTLSGIRDEFRTYPGRAPPMTGALGFEGAGSSGTTVRPELLPVFTIYPADEDITRQSAAPLRVRGRIAHGDFLRIRMDRIRVQYGKRRWDTMHIAFTSRKGPIFFNRLKE